MHPDSPPDITSTRNRWIKLARSLHRRKNRYRERAVLVEGVRPIREALAASVSFRALLIAESFDFSEFKNGLWDALTSASVPVLRVDDRVFNDACDTETPQGVLAIVDMPETGIPPITARAPMILIADSVRDPGNLGTLFRSALGAGADLVLIGPGCVDPYSPKVIRAGAGSHFRLPLAFLDWNRYPDDIGHIPIYVTDADSQQDYAEVDWTAGGAIVVGNETKGVSEGAISRADGRLGIPLANKLESLNAGIAGSVILFEAWRQRRQS
jgi:RNA methyltransferase, TrmH family